MSPEKPCRHDAPLKYGVLFRLSDGSINSEWSRREQRAYYHRKMAESPEEYKSQRRQWTEIGRSRMTPEEYKASLRAANLSWRLKHPDNFKITQWKAIGMLPDEARKAWDAYITTTSCQICGSSFKSTRQKHPDHDHATGRIRGIICMKCNTTLGWLGDSSDSIRKFLTYLAGDGSI